jgi:D-3-phosphoglycerate dehydrogenase
VDVLCFDIKGGVGDDNARQVGIMELKQKCDVVSLHVPQTESTIKMITSDFINDFHKNFWLLNTARGKCIVTEDLVNGLKSGKILGAGLDVLEYEKASFENMFTEKELPAAFKYLIEANNVVLTPHVAGWTLESKIKLAQTVVDKIKQKFI